MGCVLKIVVVKGGVVVLEVVMVSGVGFLFVEVKVVSVVVGVGVVVGGYGSVVLKGVVSSSWGGRWRLIMR